MLLILAFFKGRFEQKKSKSKMIDPWFSPAGFPTSNYASLFTESENDFTSMLGMNLDDPNGNEFNKFNITEENHLVRKFPRFNSCIMKG